MTPFHNFTSTQNTTKNKWNIMYFLVHINSDLGTSLKNVLIYRGHVRLPQKGLNLFGTK